MGASLHSRAGNRLKDIGPMFRFSTCGGEAGTTLLHYLRPLLDLD